MLQVINQGIKSSEVKNDISVTYCGAHSVPKYVSEFWLFISSRVMTLALCKVHLYGMVLVRCAEAATINCHNQRMRKHMVLFLGVCFLYKQNAFEKDCFGGSFRLTLRVASTNASSDAITFLNQE